MPVAADPGCAPLLRKMLRGEDLRPWYQEDEGNWLIVMPSGFTRQATGLTEEGPAWAWPTAHHPALSTHLAQFEQAARNGEWGMNNEWLESQGSVSMREIWIAYHYPAANPSGKRAVSR